MYYNYYKLYTTFLAQGSIECNLDCDIGDAGYGRFTKKIEHHLVGDNGDAGYGDVGYGIFKKKKRR